MINKNKTRYTKSLIILIKTGEEVARKVKKEV